MDEGFNQSASDGMLDSVSQYDDFLDKMINKLITYLAPFHLVVIMIGMGCEINLRQIMSHFWPPVGILIGMCGQSIILPAVAISLANLFSLRPYETIGALLMGCSPGGAFSNFYTYWMNGDVALSIVMTTCSSFLAFGAMPFNLWIYSRFIPKSDDVSFVIPYINIFKGLCFVLVPAIVGMIIRHFSVIIAQKITKITTVMASFLVPSGVVLLCISYGKYILRASTALYVSSFLLPFVGFIVGYAFAWILRQDHKKCRTIGIETGCQNLFITTSIILLTYEEPEIRKEVIVFPSLYSVFLLVVMFVIIALFQLWVKCKPSSKHYENAVKNQDIHA